MAMTTFSAKEWEKLMEDQFLKEMMMKNNPLMNVGAVDSASYPSHSHSRVGGYVSGDNSSGNHTHAYTRDAAATQSSPDRWGESTLLNMLGSRMLWGIRGKCPFQKVVPWKVTDKVLVIIVTKDEGVVLEDDPNLYPSDALVTQVRLLEEAL